MNIRHTSFVSIGFLQKLFGLCLNFSQFTIQLFFRERHGCGVEVFGWGRIPNNTESWSRTFLSDSDSGCRIGSFFTSHS